LSILYTSILLIYLVLDYFKPTSATVKMLLRKGIKAYHVEKSRAT
jgi:hypothetical protein